MPKSKQKTRPDSVGFWWCNDNGRVSIGRAKYIDKICYDGDFDDGSKELAWSSGGCFIARVEQSTMETSTALSGLNKNRQNFSTKTLATIQTPTTCANIATAGNTLAQIAHDSRFYPQASPS